MFRTLLYYKYLHIVDVSTAVAEHVDKCEAWGLRGRVRISPEGLNGTLDGLEEDVGKYVQWMDAHATFGSSGIGTSDSGGGDDGKSDTLRPHRDIHWKYGWCLAQQRLPRLSVKAAKEVVSLDLTPEVDSALRWVDGGEHLAPAEFHAQLEAYTMGGGGQGAEGAEKTKMQPAAVLLDVRNLYESRIGHFQAGDAVPTLDPQTRKFSDFSEWVDQHIEEFKGKAVFAYCTGGVRCEKASQYLRYKGATDVKQLSGGICAYMDAFPNGGLFRGKNFVYDPRIAVPYKGDEASQQCVGSCAFLACGVPCDDYGPQQRCCRCRMLILVCSTCLASQSSDCVAALVCEHCATHGRGHS
jgi:predicted sulfurtransferase